MIHELQQIHVPVILKSPLPPRQKKIQAQMGTANPSPGGTSASSAKTLRLTLTTSPPWASLSFFPARRSDFTSATRPFRAMGPWGLEETGG